MGSCISIRNTQTVKTNKNKNMIRIKESIESINKKEKNLLPIEAKEKDILIISKNKKNPRDFTDKNKTQSNPILNSQNHKDQIIIDSNILVRKSSGILESSYKIKKMLGQGTYGKVFLAKHKISGQNRAIKFIEKDFFDLEGNIDEKLNSNIENEIEIIKSLDHPCILKIFEFFNTKKAYYLITEYCKEGELFEKIVSKGSFNEDETAYIMYQIISAVNYCHKNNVIHRDLKPENILIIREQKIKSKKLLQIKLVDFGTAKILEKNNKESRVIGSSYFIAPEVLRKSYNEKCDMWSIGVVLFILLTGVPPFFGDEKEILYKIKKGKFNLDDYRLYGKSSEVKNLLRKLMEYDYEKRISAENALEHEWFKKLGTKDLISLSDEEIIRKVLQNLKTYSPYKTLKNIAIAYLVHNNPQHSEVEKVNKVFFKIDSNNNGKIRKNELMEYLVENGIADEENCTIIDRIFNKIDSDNNNYIEYEEFIRGAIDKQNFLKEDVIKMSFNFFDKDSNGEITHEEIKQIFNLNGKNRKSINKNKKYINDNMIKEMIKEVDENNDGKISYKEFLKMMRNILD